MKLNSVQKLLANSPVRALVQGRLDAPRLERLSGRLQGGTALEIGCGCGGGLQISVVFTL